MSTNPNEAHWMPAIDQLRRERDQKLEECDWTQSRDVELSNDTDWKTYRQALRDLTKTASPKWDFGGRIDYDSFTWPTKPSS